MIQVLEVASSTNDHLVSAPDPSSDAPAERVGGARRKGSGDTA